MSIERSSPESSLLEAARIVAKGGEIEAKLDALAAQALEAGGAAQLILYLFDPASRLLVPGGSAGVDPGALARLQIEGDDPSDVVARVGRERRPETVTALAEASKTLGGALPDARSLLALPLVAVDDVGGQDLQGVLVAAFPDERAASAGSEEAMAGMADLSAIAIRQARLEHALQERADWYERVAYTDALTGLANRRTFDRMLELELARSARQKSEVCVALFDVDDLVGINEREGAATADDALRRVASTLADQIRLVDTVARYGADEFALIAPGRGGGVVARRIRDAVAALELDGTRSVTVSAGVARFPDDGRSAEEMVAAAERALDQAKQRGPGEVVAPADDEGAEAAATA